MFIKTSEPVKYGPVRIPPPRKNFFKYNFTPPPKQLSGVPSSTLLEYYTYSMNKEQYKTYLRQRLTENLLITEVTASPAGQPVPTTRGPRLKGLEDATKNPFMSKNKRAEILSLINAKSGKLPYDQEAEVAATPGGDRQAKVGTYDDSSGTWKLVDAPWKANEYARDLNRNASFNADEANAFRNRRQGRPEENQIISSHPHGTLTHVLARHLGLDASDVFETTGALTADSPQEHIDGAIGDLISQHGDRLFNKLSNEPGDPYHTPPARYGSSPERDFDAYDARDTEVERQYDRFVGDLTDHINDNVSTGVHTEFAGIHRDDGT